MANEEDDLDLLLSLHDRVLETPPGTPPGTPPHTSGTMAVSSTMVTCIQESDSIDSLRAIKMFCL